MIIPQTLFFHHHLSREYMYERKDYGIKANGYIRKGTLLALDRSLSSSNMQCLVDFLHLHSHTDFVRSMRPCNLLSPPNLYDANKKAMRNLFGDKNKMSLVDKINYINSTCRSNAFYQNITYDEIEYFRVDAIQDIQPGEEITIMIPPDPESEPCMCNPLDLMNHPWITCQDYYHEAKIFSASLEKERPSSYFIDKLDHWIAHFLQILTQHSIYIVHDQLRGNEDSLMNAQKIFKVARLQLDKYFDYNVVNKRLSSYYSYFRHKRLI